MTTVARLGCDPHLRAYLRPFERLFHRPENREACEAYLLGLLSDLPRKNCERIAEAVPDVSAQALQQFLCDTPWDPEAMDRLRLEPMREQACEADGVLILDDTGLPKQGKHSVGVARQYSGTLGKVGNCQILVTCYYADPVWDWPVAGRLYLPERWASDPERREQARVPEEVGFARKPEIALALLDRANEAGIPHVAVVADAAYGDNPGFLDGLEQRRERYVVGVSKDFTVRLPHEVQAERQVPRPRRGRPRTRPTAPLHTAASLLEAQPASAWRTIEWREGSQGPLRKQFSALRAYRATRERTGILGWLIFERPIPGQDGDLKFWFSDFPEETPLERMVELAHRRYLVERGYQDDKQELGLDDFQGRTWWGFHRHVALVMLAHCFLVLQRWVLADPTSPRPTPTPESSPSALLPAEPALPSLKSLVAPLVHEAPAEWNGNDSHHPLFPPRVSLAWLHRLVRVVMALTFSVQMCADLLAWLRILRM